MDRSKADKATILTNRIKSCETFLSSLDGRAYNDEFVIYYRGMEACDLEDDARKLLVSYYKEELIKLEQELKRL